jgi:hypothetical protein
MKDRFLYIEPTFRINPNGRHGTAAGRHFSGASGAVDVKPSVVGTGNEISSIWSGGLVFPLAFGGKADIFYSVRA